MSDTMQWTLTKPFRISQQGSCKNFKDTGFDTTRREGLGKITVKFGCPHQFITIIAEWHDYQSAE